MRQPTPAPFAIVLLALCTIYFAWLYFRERKKNPADKMRDAFLTVLHEWIMNLQTSRYPSCEDELMKVFNKDIADQDFSTWTAEDDLTRIALANIYSTSYDLLATQRYTLHPGVFNMIGNQLWHVMSGALNEANRRGYVTDEEIKAEQKNFNDNVLYF